MRDGRRIGVLGAGAVGGALAALLDRAGHEVLVTARGEHADALRAHGLLLTGGWGESVHPLAVVDRLPADLDLVVLATKAHDSVAALEAARACDGVPVVVVQNGLGGADAVRDALPHSPVAIGLALFAASLVGPGRIAITGPAGLTLGGDAAALAVALPLLTEALPAPVGTASNVLGAQWTKLLVNQVNALPAITGLSVQQVVAHDALRRLLVASMRETAAVGRALGVAWATIGPIGPAAVDALLAEHAAPGGSLPGEDVPRALAAGMGDEPNPASTLQSIRRGRTTEIDALNGAVVAAGGRAGIATPVNAALVALVHGVERSGAFLAPEAVVAAVERGLGDR
ncbi:2-dehydropantoate 2-reductase [Microcella daejeonensis]|uniref:ketopantoate reductase family protein n=1 Tax=Microcella daejeonensis TaxID=2994971 RepID=UPI00226F5B52|nr:2-dehydropantoate 2-reductase [Microcella daejeonensis]WAB83229.1 2-dehydropantoate 2-reductase [Microcella daejeonensis]